jgi:uncharacterized protein (TIGR02231 family)
MAATESMVAPIVLDAKVARVLVMEDRAQVERRGELAIAGGLCRLEVPGVSLAAVDRSLRCEVRGARLLDAKLVRRWREKPAGGLDDGASDLRRREHELVRESLERADTVARLSAGGEVLAAARADVLRAIAESSGCGGADPVTWGDQLASLSSLQAEGDEALRVARRELERVERMLGEARAALAASEQADRDLACSLALTVESEGPAQLFVRASYLVPCAAWRPAYRATLLRASGSSSVRLEAEAVVWQHTGEHWDGVEVALSTSRPTLGTTPPSLLADELTTRPKQEQEKRVVQLMLREQAIQTAGEQAAAGLSEMPGLDDGGEARLLRPPGHCSIPSDGQPHRLPLSSFEARAELEHVCPAELTPLVSLVARFPNASGDVLLAGPVDIIRGSGFTGRTRLAFTAPGEAVKLSFGSEDGLRVIRVVDQRQDESRLTGRHTTTHTVRHFVSNAAPEPAHVVIEERVPVSEVKEVEVEVVAAQCRPVPLPPSKEGIARIGLDLPANGTCDAKFVWTLSAASTAVGL